MAENGEQINTTPLLPRACQNCAKRKVRCDKSVPQCSNCRTAGLRCNVETPRPAEHRQRVLISNRYERKIDAIENRLGKIEQLLEALLPRLASGTDGPPPLLSNSRSKSKTEPPASESIPPYGPPSGPSDEPMDESQSPRFEGESSITAHSYDARRTLDNLIEASPNIRQDPDIIAALKKLQVAMQEYTRQLSGASAQRSSLDQTDNFAVCNRITTSDHPPIAETCKILREVRRGEYMSFVALAAFIHPDELLAFCEETYADLGNAPLASQTLTAGVVFYSFAELVETPQYKDDKQMLGYRNALLQAFDTCISRFRLMVDPSSDSMLALLLCAGHGFQIGDFALAWASICAACRTMRNLGWHRASHFAKLSEKEASQRRNIFWVAFIMDKILALRFGCASNLQDWDITLDLPTVTEGSPFTCWQAIFRASIEVAKIHGIIYEKLYSPAAANASRQRKNDHVQWLVHRLNTFANTIINIPNPPDSFQRDRFEANRLECQVMIGSLLTLTQRASPPSQFSQDQTTHQPSSPLFSIECLEAARGTMRLHQQTAAWMRTLGEVDLIDYVGWTILNSPFTPFHVIFCNVVTSLDLNDLSLLEDFVASMYSIPSQQTTGAVETFRRLCSAFCDLAKHYIAACLKDTSGSSGSGSATAVSGTTPLALDAWASGMLASIQPSFGNGASVANEDSVFMQLCEEWLANGQGTAAGLGNGFSVGGGSALGNGFAAANGGGGSGGGGNAGGDQFWGPEWPLI